MSVFWTASCDEYRDSYQDTRIMGLAMINVHRVLISKENPLAGVEDRFVLPDVLGSSVRTLRLNCMGRSPGNQIQLKSDNFPIGAPFIRHVCEFHFWFSWLDRGWLGLIIADHQQKNFHQDVLWIMRSPGQGWTTIKMPSMHRPGFPVFDGPQEFKQDRMAHRRVLSSANETVFAIQRLSFPSGFGQNFWQKIGRTKINIEFF